MLSQSLSLKKLTVPLPTGSSEPLVRPEVRGQQSHPPHSSESFADSLQSQVNMGPQIWSQTFLCTLREDVEKEGMAGTCGLQASYETESPLSTCC